MRLLLIYISILFFLDTKAQELSGQENLFKVLEALPGNLNSKVDLRRQCGNLNADNEEQLFVVSTHDYECEEFELSEETKNLNIVEEDKKGLQIVSFGSNIGLGNDNFLAAFWNDDFGLTWYKQIEADLGLENSSGDKLNISFHHFGGQYTTNMNSGRTVLSTDQDWSTYSYRDHDNDGRAWVYNQASLSKYLNELNIDFTKKKGLYLAGSVGHVFIDADENQTLADRQISHHQNMDIYNFDYKSNAFAIDGFKENTSYVFIRAGAGVELEKELGKGVCRLKARPSVSLQTNFAWANKATIARFQPRFNLGASVGLGNYPERSDDLNIVEIYGDFDYNPNEVLPENTDSGFKSTATLGVRVHYITKDINLNKRSPNSFQIRLGLTPFELTKGLGHQDRIVPSNINPNHSPKSDNGLIGKWAVGTIVIVPNLKKK